MKLHPSLRSFIYCLLQRNFPNPGENTVTYKVYWNQTFPSATNSKIEQAQNQHKTTTQRKQPPHENKDVADLICFYFNLDVIDLHKELYVFVLVFPFICLFVCL